MTRFLFQLMLSLFIGLGAAVGFNAEAREKVKDTWSDAKIRLRDTTQAAIETVIGHDLEAETSVEAALESDVEAELSKDTEVEANVELDAEAENETELTDATLELENEIESVMNVDLNLDN